MKLYTIAVDGRETIALQADDALYDLSDLAPDMLALVRGGDALWERAKAVPAQRGRTRYLLAGVKLRAPIPRPGKILCSGLNYKSHVEENPGAVFPDEPDVFCKVSSAVIGPGEPIVLPAMSSQVDYEVELAVVIGRRMHHTGPADVMERIFGYTILHDVSARDVQFKPNGRTCGKNFDTFAPIGPCIVTADELREPHNLGLRLYLNGQLMQNGTTRDWLFSLPNFFAYLSSIMTLEPGDILSTGTPAGIGYFRKPRVFLKSGDECVLEVDGIGRLTNPVQ